MLSSLVRCLPQLASISRGVASPQLFGIALKEHAVELFAKAVDVVIFQVVVGTLVQRGAKEAHAHLHGGGKAHGF